MLQYHVVPVGLVQGLLQALGLLQVAGETVQNPASAGAVHSAQTLPKNLQHQGVWNYTSMSIINKH